MMAEHDANDPQDRLEELIANYARNKSQRWDTGRFRAIKALFPDRKRQHSGGFRGVVGPKQRL